MKLPRDVSGEELVKRLKVFGYEPTRQAGSHLRVTTTQRGEHHVTIPRHNPLKLGTLSGILKDIAEHFDISRDEVIQQIFGK